MNRLTATLRGRRLRQRLPVGGCAGHAQVRGDQGYVGAIGIHGVNVEVIAFLAFSREGDSRAIGRPIRFDIACRVACEVGQAAAINIDDLHFFAELGHRLLEVLSFDVVSFKVFDWEGPSVEGDLCPVWRPNRLLSRISAFGELS